MLRNGTGLSPSSILHPLDASLITTALGPLGPAFAIRTLDTCASTNAELVETTPSDDGRVHVVLAETQTAGRGRRGRRWLSWPGTCLTFSSLWRFHQGAPVPAGLSLVAGLALASHLESLGIAGVQLKWPNDVLILGEKVAGILVELVPGHGRTPAAVVGIGINIDLPADASIPDQARVGDLARHLGATPDRNRLAAGVLSELHRLFETYASAGFPALRHAWEQRNAFAGLPVTIQGDSENASGICEGVDVDGALLLRNDNGVARILSGEVSLRAHS